MTVLKAIGGFFAKIGRWIKDTAWVQPLLIVGGIFAIIFAINPISKWVGSWFTGGNEAEDYYYKFQYSLKGAESGTSDADKLISYLEKPTAEGKKQYGSKFYVNFVSEGCPNCEDCYKGFELFEENFNKSESFKVDQPAEGFKMYTIFCDQKNDDDELLVDDLLRNHANFFEQLFGSLNELVESETYNYYVNTSDKTSFKADVKSFIDCINADEDDDGAELPTPTTFLFDTNAGAVDAIYGNITEVFFNYSVDAASSTDNYSKAYLLRDSWNYYDIFGDKKAKQ